VDFVIWSGHLCDIVGLKFVLCLWNVKIYEY